MAKHRYSNREIAVAATQIRKRILKFALERGGCYLTQACSSAEIVATLYMRILNIGPSIGNPEAQPFPGVPSPNNMDYPKGWFYNGEHAPERDRLFVSCCHYASVIYCALAATGRISESALDKFNVDGWNMEMIGAEHSPGFENTAGSLGQTVSTAAGVAHAYKLKNYAGRIFCILSDGELEEGQDWECFQTAAFYNLDNFIVIVDVNHQQLEGWTRDVMNIEPLEKRFEAFGWKALRINGHNINALTAASTTEHPDQPLVILCDTSPAQGIRTLDSIVPKHFVTINEGNRSAFQAEYDRM